MSYCIVSYLLNILRFDIVVHCITLLSSNSHLVLHFQFRNICLYNFIVNLNYFLLQALLSTSVYQVAHRQIITLSIESPQQVDGEDILTVSFFSCKKSQICYLLNAQTLQSESIKIIIMTAYILQRKSKVTLGKDKSQTEHWTFFISVCLGKTNLYFEIVN